MLGFIGLSNGPYASDGDPDPHYGRPPGSGSAS